MTLLIQALLVVILLMVVTTFGIAIYVIHQARFTIEERRALHRQIRRRYGLQDDHR